MSVQFGRWNFDSRSVDRSYLEKVKPLLVPYGPDDLGSYSNGNISIVYCAFHTTKESRREKQPYLTASGAVITWDGRLDNRDDFIARLSDTVTPESTDASIVAAAYERWGRDCFATLIGDWALSIWEPRARSLILAKDPIGARHLYYSCEDNQVTWSTVLDPLVLFAERKFTLCEEYIAGWFSYFPATHLTPYVGIESVPPSCMVQIREGKLTVRKYWDFDPNKRIRYRNDREYEEHFRCVFREAVRRRLRSDSPILAELSGGMDSSSIVCMADTIISRGDAETPRLDTVSYYDDSEPNWNERPYFTRVEAKRGRTGCHIDFSQRELFPFESDRTFFAAVPGSIGRPSKAVKQFAACLATHGNRVAIAGIGGDEVMGGVPTPIPELTDLLARAQFRTLAHQLKVWALNKRVPWFHLLFMSAGRFLPAKPFEIRKKDGPHVWLDPMFVQRNRKALHACKPSIRLFGPLPSFQANMSTFIGLQQQIASDALQADLLFEKRYPFLDRGLLEFVYGIPREQLVRPGRRRSLMRRALQEIVPTEILERKRKAWVFRSPLVSLQAARCQIEMLLSHALTVQYGFMDRKVLAEFSDCILSGKETKEWSLLMKVLVLEVWLKSRADSLRPIRSGKDCLQDWGADLRRSEHLLRPGSGLSC